VDDIRFATTFGQTGNWVSAQNLLRHSLVGVGEELPHCTALADAYIHFDDQGKQWWDARPVGHFFHSEVPDTLAAAARMRYRLPSSTSTRKIRPPRMNHAHRPVLKDRHVGALARGRRISGQYGSTRPTGPGRRGLSFVVVF